MGVLYYPGLEGIVAATTSISDMEPDQGSIVYRGHDIFELVEHSTFEEVCFLLLCGRMPDAKELKNFSTSLAQNRDIPRELVEMFKHIPYQADHMDVLRTTAAFLGMVDPEAGDHSGEAAFRKAMRTIAKLPTAIAASHRISQHQAPIHPAWQLPHAQNFLYMLSGYGPDEDAVTALDTVLILYAEHASDVSSFTARVAASSFTDYHSAVTSAIGSFKGGLHGAADEEAMRMLFSIKEADCAETWIKDALAKGEQITENDHETHQPCDARTQIMKQLSRVLAKKIDNMSRHNMCEKIEEIMLQEKGLHSTLGFYAGQVLYMLGIPMELWTPVFAAGRISGWSAHVIEQFENNRVIRPQFEYQGRENPFFPIKKAEKASGKRIKSIELSKKQPA